MRASVSTGGRRERRSRAGREKPASAARKRSNAERNFGGWRIDSAGRDSAGQKGVPMKRFLICVAGFSVGIGLTAGIAMTGTTQSAGTAAGSAAKKITIRHQLHGCHAWSLNGGPYRVVLRTSVARGGSITFVDNDVMPHTLVQKSGAAVRFRGNPA